jgi:hypothetical protein
VLALGAGLVGVLPAVVAPPSGPVRVREVAGVVEP